MFYGDSVQETRHLFFSSWEKFQHQEPLSALEHEIVQVILAHPQYHSLLEHQDKFLQQTYFPELGEPNPFLHMGLHLALREQLVTNRPAGMSDIYAHLVKKYNDPEKVEHLIMEQLAECLWYAQKNNVLPDEQAYLQTLTHL